jgi:hypothetical protein
MTTAPKIKEKRGAEIVPGDQLLLDDGRFAKVTELVKAPMHIQRDDGSFAPGVRWAYLANPVGGHATICADDTVTVKA